MSDLFTHQQHFHMPRNVNEQHKRESQGLNARIAILVTRSVGTMTCAYLFALLALIGWPGRTATPTQWVQWLSQTFIQLVMLSILAVSQSVLGRKAELQADEEYNTTQKTYHDAEQMKQHMDAQDTVILELKDILLMQSAMIKQLLEKPARSSRKKEIIRGNGAAKASVETTQEA